MYQIFFENHADDDEAKKFETRNTLGSCFELKNRFLNESSTFFIKRVLVVQ